MKATASELARVAEKEALLPYHGKNVGEKTNIDPLIAHFPKWNVSDADDKWCAAFVYHSCAAAGFEIPYSPDECITCSLAGCGGWDEYAIGDKRIGYFKGTSSFTPQRGDIVLYDRVFCGKEHDHIGIVLKVTDTQIVTAEGNIGGVSKIVTRERDDHIRAYIRFPDGYRY